MPQNYIEGSITYQFPDDLVVFRPEDSTFYSRHWQSFAAKIGAEGNAEVDFVVFDTSTKHLWLIEAKDYRFYGRTKPSEIGQEFARKCRDTLALLAALQVSSAVATEADVQARYYLSKMRAITCVLHLEQNRGTKGQYHIISPQTLKDTVRRSLRALDPHAKAGDTSFLATRVLPCTIIL